MHLEYSVLLLDVKNQILDNSDNQFILKEARGLIYNMRHVSNLPEELGLLVRGYNPEKYFTGS